MIIKNLHSLQEKQMLNYAKVSTDLVQKYFIKHELSFNCQLPSA